MFEVFSTRGRKFNEQPRAGVKAEGDGGRIGQVAEFK